MQVYNHVINQLPAFVAEDYPQFVLFLQKYYEFLEGELVKIETARDTDETEFLSELTKELVRGLDSISKLSESEQRLVAQKISDLYKSKGSEDSVISLIRILFKTESELFYPSTQVFKSSDAVWNRDVSVRFVIDTGLLNSFENIAATITTPQSVFDIDILKIKKVRGATNLFEAFLDVKYKLIIPNGGTISTDSFTGTLVRSTYKKKIINRGAKFSVGDIFEINNSGGTGTKIKVTRVDANTGMMSFDIVEFGVGYETSFVTELQPLTIIESSFSKNLNVKVLDENDIVTQNIDTTTDDNISRIGESILITKFDYVDNPNYFEDNSYVSDTIYSNEETITIKVDESGSNAAVILFELGYVFEYPGYYSTNVGFPSDTSFLFDGEYYQQFSYIIKTASQFNEYESAVKTLVHPAGMKVFGDYTISRQLELLISIKDRLNILETSLLDSFTTSDAINSKFVFKNIEDTVAFFELLSKSVSRTLGEEVTATDFPAKTLTKNLSDTQAVGDVIDTKELQKNITDLVDLFEIQIKHLEKTLEEEIISADDGGVINNMYYSYDDLVQYSQPYWEFGYTVNETAFT